MNYATEPFICWHDSQTGADQTPMSDDRKVWRCDACDVLIRRGRIIPTVDGHRPRIRQMYGGGWTMTCYGCDIVVFSSSQPGLLRLGMAHLFDVTPIPDELVMPDPIVGLEFAWRYLNG